jgi:hypothetical protein
MFFAGDYDESKERPDGTRRTTRYDASTHPQEADNRTENTDAGGLYAAQQAAQH